MNIISEKFITTKKMHQCFGCERNFKKNSKMARQVAADSGEIWATYTCNTCNKLLKLNPKYKNGEPIFVGDVEGFFQGIIRETLSEFDAATPEELLLLFDKQ